MTDLFKLILGVLASLFRSRAKLEAEILVLRQQINAYARAREGVTRKQHLLNRDGLHPLNRDGSIPSANVTLTVQFRPTCAFFVLAPGRPLSPARTP